MRCTKQGSIKKNTAKTNHCMEQLGITHKCYCQRKKVDFAVAGENQGAFTSCCGGLSKIVLNGCS